MNTDKGIAMRPMKGIVPVQVKDNSWKVYGCLKYEILTGFNQHFQSLNKNIEPTTNLDAVFDQMEANLSDNCIKGRFFAIVDFNEKEDGVKLLHTVSIVRGSDELIANRVQISASGEMQEDNQTKE